MTKIHLIRHGEAAGAWGEAEDPGLSERGKRQAAQRSELMRPGRPTISSPLKRCQETAAFYNKEFIIDERVREIAQPEGLRNRREWLNSVMVSDWPSQAKLLTDWRSGIIELLDSLREDTVIFTHFVVINVAVGHAMGRDEVVVFKPDHCSQTVIEIDTLSWNVNRLGETAVTEVR